MNCEIIVMYLSLLVYTFVLIWGLKLITKSFSQPDIFLKLLSEENSNSENSEDIQKPSFSRLAGAIGSIGLAAVFIGIGYWIIYSLFSGGKLEALDGIGTYFLSGSAIFAPYALNQLGKVFK